MNAKRNVSEFCGMDEVMANLNKNYKLWQSMQEKGIMKLEELPDEFELGIASGVVLNSEECQPNNIASAEKCVL